MIRILCLIVTLSAALVAALSIDKADFEWQQFKIKFGKHYSVQDEKRRHQVYLDNKDTWTRHNQEAADGKHAFTLGPNEYSDLTLDEIKEAMNGFTGVGQPRTGKPFKIDEDVAVPSTVDWRDSGVVTPVKNQEQCGSCWAFSSTGALEAANARKTGNLVSLSEQNLVDCCVGKWGNSGCGGGWMDNAFNYVKAKGGLDTEKYYPYLGQDWYCFFNPDPAAIGGHDSGHVDVKKGNETELMYAVATHGPVSVAIDATHSSFSSYRSGVMYEPKCSSTDVDHAVLVVGYGTLDGHDYWLVKNSWGESYGDKGYIRMSRNRGNNCGIASFASYPLA